MAKLTVYFKNNIVHSYPLVADKMMRIGRDNTNDLVVDSPAFAPTHAVIVVRGNNCVIKQLNDDFPLIINGKKTKAANLYHGDTLTIGQHQIVYDTNQATDNAKQFDQSSKQTTAPTRKIKNGSIQPVANYQVISGANLGKIFHLKTPMTLLGEQGSGIVIISKRKDGYFVSILEHSATITLNKQPLNSSTVKLHHDDILVVGDMTVQFGLL